MLTILTNVQKWRLITSHFSKLFVSSSLQKNSNEWNIVPEMLSVLTIIIGLCRYSLVEAREKESTKTISTTFVTQNLGTPFRGEHSGVAVVDLNHDGYPDVLFSAGRHDRDQPYAMINLGRKFDSSNGGNVGNYEDDDVDGMMIQFSSALPFGDPGGYYQVDTFQGLSTLPPDHTAVLLAGGGGWFGTTPAVLLDVVVRGCSVLQPEEPCELSWSTIWTDPEPQSDRNGAFAPMIINPASTNGDPAFVLTSSACTGIYLPDPLTGKYGKASFVVTPTDKDPGDDNNVNRATGLAVGFIGGLPGVVVGARTFQGRSPPPPLIAIVQQPSLESAQFQILTFDDGLSYEGNRFEALQPVGIVLDDINGDGVMDVVVANYVTPYRVDSKHPVPQWYYELHVDNFTGGHISTMDRNVAMNAKDVAGRSVDSGVLFVKDRIDGEQRALPDLVYGTTDGTIHFLANLGVNGETGKFLGFDERLTFQLEPDCQIRDVLVASLEPCTTSVVCAVRCTDRKASGNVIFHSTQYSCVPSPHPTSGPSSQPTSGPSSHPTSGPSSHPTESLYPSSVPSQMPTVPPSESAFPSDLPSLVPSQTT